MWEKLKIFQSQHSAMADDKPEVIYQLPEKSLHSILQTEILGCREILQCNGKPN